MNGWTLKINLQIKQLHPILQSFKDTTEYLFLSPFLFLGSASCLLCDVVLFTLQQCHSYLYGYVYSNTPLVHCCYTILHTI